MSSGFVSGGTTDQPLERDDEWRKAQHEIEVARKKKEDESRHEGGKSLYEVLQQNKAAKQEAFEESIRLKNQFRNLDEDEVEFLDSVLESTRAKEEAVKKETREQLEIFRRQQEETDQTLIRSSENEGRQLGTSHNTVSTSDEPQWTVSARKRKRAMEREFLKGVKLRKSLSTRDPLTATTHMQVSMQPPVTVEAASNELGADTGDPNDGASVDQLSLTAAKSASDREIEAQTSVYASLERSGSRKAGQVLDLGLVDYASDAD